jgi:hypothetical protein
MRITINTDDKGKLSIDTGDTGDVRPGVFEGTTDVPVIDAGPAPIQEIERMQSVTAVGEVSGLSAAAATALSPEEREKELPLNPLRAGAAAAYRDPANLRNKAAGLEATFAAQPQQPSLAAIDGGAAQLPESEKSIAAPTSERQPSKKQPSKRAKRDKKR